MIFVVPAQAGIRISFDSGNLDSVTTGMTKKWRENPMKITEKLARDAFKNDKESHILFDQKICHSCKERFCIYACPANLYALTEKEEMIVEFGGCLECGTCMIACVYGSVKWKYPKSGWGVQYRFG
jgi:ferredoxin like protein